MAKKKEVEKFKVVVTKLCFFCKRRVYPGQKLKVSKSEFMEGYMEFVDNIKPKEDEFIENVDPESPDSPFSEQGVDAHDSGGTGDQNVI